MANVAYAVTEFETWKQCGYVSAFLISGEVTNVGKHFWFEDFGVVPSDYHPRNNDIIILLKCILRSPPLTQSASIAASLETLQSSFVKFMYLPKTIHCNTTLSEIVLENSKKFDKNLYTVCDKHPSLLPDDVISYVPDDFSATASVKSVFVDMFLYKISDRYFLPSPIHLLPVR
jgi:hypothetical protein